MFHKTTPDVQDQDQDRIFLVSDRSRPKSQTTSLLVYRRLATLSIPTQRGPSGPKFCGFSSLYAHTVRLRTTKFGVVTHIGSGRFRRSATPLHLHKCVARFVSNNWVSCSCVVGVPDVQNWDPLRCKFGVLLALTLFAVTFCFLAMPLPFYVSPCKTLRYEIQRVLLHFQQYLRSDL